MERYDIKQKWSELIDYENKKIILIKIMIQMMKVRKIIYTLI